MNEYEQITAPTKRHTAIYNYRMSVKPNGHTIYAHASLSMNEIVAIIQCSEDLISKFVFFVTSVGHS